MWVARALQVAARLGIADLLDDGPRPLAELADRAGCDRAALGRLLDALGTVGVFARTGTDGFGHTPMSAVLATGHPRSVGAVARLFGADWQWGAWSGLEHSIRRGDPALDHVLGIGLQAFLDGSPAEGRLFDEAMTGLSRLLNRTILNAYDFSEAGRIADVGGGHGTLLPDILAAVPKPTGVLLDKPAAAAKYRDALRGSDLADRLDVVGCDYFEPLPEKADTIVLNRVLHDWDDGPASVILRTCRDALRPGGGSSRSSSSSPATNAPRSWTCRCWCSAAAVNVPRGKRTTCSRDPASGWCGRSARPRP
ncbi:methyltransferase [Actinomadura sp. CNU-125]|uniref:methyltransferase n=1 Tax=Actinomadura sp. CNU-125 TaxID=1904961 RepID=UPI003967247E